MSLYVDGVNGLTFPDGSAQPTSGYTGFRNRIINGAMVIDQRNSGASVTVTNSGPYTVDRWQAYQSIASSKFTVQQNAGSVTPPVGFSNYLGSVSSSAYTLGSGDYFVVYQKIEGFNFYDMAWGTANARTITLSFWAYSSLTGTFGGAIQNSAQNRNWIFAYTISSPNTWTYVTLTIPGDTTGTWIGATNGIGAYVFFSLGAGSGAVGSANAWGGTGLFGVTGQINVVASNAATLYITGVQLERAGTATPFEFRPYGTELALCQRYYQTFGSSDAPLSGYTDQVTITYVFPVQMRANPVLTHPYTDGTYDSSGPAVGKWSFNRAYVTNIAKSAGTITSQTQIQNAWAQIYLYGMTLASVPTGINSNSQTNITFSAEL